MEFKVDNVYACEPINTLLKILLEKGFVIESSKVSDYHFNELYFLLRTDLNNLSLDEINIDKIGRYSQRIFFCTCHWSIAELRAHNGDNTILLFEKYR